MYDTKKCNVGDEDSVQIPPAWKTLEDKRGKQKRSSPTKISRHHQQICWPTVCGNTGKESDQSDNTMEYLKLASYKLVTTIHIYISDDGSKAVHFLINQCLKYSKSSLPWNLYSKWGTQ